MIDHILGQEGQIIPTTTNKHGDQVAGTPIDIKCRFRYLTGIERGQNFEALVGIDAIIWVSADTDVSEGTIINVDGNSWRVERLVKARRMSGDTVEFLKAYVQKHSM